jgi:multidrug efflux pump subunit AcrA (membrane-fusion protein)
MKNRYILTGLVSGFLLIALFLFIKITSGTESDALDFATAKEGDLEIVVSGTGELIAERSVEINGPRLVQYRNIRIAGIKITDIVPEGTKVEKGDYIATLDKSNFDNSLKDELTELDKMKTALEMKKIDTSLILNDLRNEIRNQRFVVDEAHITVLQSKFEPPARIRLAELDLEKSERLLNQKKKLLKLKKLQEETDLKNLRTNFNIQQRKVDELESLLTQFMIRAPSKGIVVFKTDRQGVKIKSGSTLNPFSPVVATLPDLSSMLSRIYISETDINKILPGQPVQITVEALQGKNLTGHVVSKANIGEEFSNSDSKMFEVLVRVNDEDPQLRPLMTTGNRMIIKSFRDVIFVPIESVYAGADSIPYVYTEDGVRQVVLLGESNDKNIIVERGLKPGMTIWRRIPDNPDKYKLEGNELIAVIREREKIRQAELKNIRTDDLISGSDEKSDTAKANRIVIPTGSAN